MRPAAYNTAHRICRLHSNKELFSPSPRPQRQTHSLHAFMHRHHPDPSQHHNDGCNAGSKGRKYLLWRIAQLVHYPLIAWFEQITGNTPAAITHSHRRNVQSHTHIPPHTHTHLWAAELGVWQEADNLVRNQGASQDTCSHPGDGTH